MSAGGPLIIVLLLTSDLSI